MDCMSDMWLHKHVTTCWCWCPQAACILLFSLRLCYCLACLSSVPRVQTATEANSNHCPTAPPPACCSIVGHAVLVVVLLAAVVVEMVVMAHVDALLAGDAGEQEASDPLLVRHAVVKA